MKGFETATVVEPSSYTPVEGDFELLKQASVQYWYGMHSSR